ncbi:hypothetical protein KJ786_01410 [Patescibacteria group bacterium]|nr:hypothetical protein [Patescibacteria group bacterium]
MKLDKKNYQFLLRLYSRVSEYLTESRPEVSDLPEIIVSFCIVVEKILKIKLHQKNSVLVFDNCKIKENDALIAIVNNKEFNIETIKIREVISRYKLMFEKELSDGEIQAILDIYNIRSHFIHSHRKDGHVLFDSENIIKKMGTVWDKISIQAIDLFGKGIIKTSKPKKKYTEAELEEVLKEQVSKKIKNLEPYYGVTASSIFRNETCLRYSPTMGGIVGEEECPRCGSFSFSVDNAITDPFSESIYLYSKGTPSDLYKCKKCHLELTRKEYELAKKIKGIK